MSAPTIAEPPAETRPTPPDIQQCANEGLHRTITDRPPGGRAVVGGGQGAGGAGTRGRVGSRPRAVVRLQQWRRGRAVPRDGRQPGGGLAGAWTALGGAARRAAGASVRGTPGDAGAARARGHGGVLRGMFAGMGAGLGVGLVRHTRRERVDIGGEVGADLALALAGINARVVSGEEHPWSARPRVFVFNHQSERDPILITRRCGAGSRAWRRRRLRTVGAGNSVRP